MNTKDILLVEDNALNRKVVVRYFNSRGFGVVQAETTRQAEAWLAERTPMAILMDVSLPDEDGLTFVTRLRQDHGLAAPIIAVTAHAMAGDCERALEAGCDAYFSKPVELSTLLDAVIALSSRQPEVA